MDRLATPRISRTVASSNSDRGTGLKDMKTYAGERSLSGALVTVDGVPLPPRLDVYSFSRTGFEWSYAGPAPQQLALALLADHLNDDGLALKLSEPFMRAVVAQLDNAWALTSEDIAAALTGLKRV
jgi:Family of unknown function (DUF6166)